jgi:hypothetical protein
LIKDETSGPLKYFSLTFTGNILFSETRVFLELEEKLNPNTFVLAKNRRNKLIC